MESLLFLDADTVKVLYKERRSRKKQVLKWFQSERDILLRHRTPNHESIETNRTRCGLCKVNNEYDIVSIKMTTECSLREIHLCTERRQYRESCWEL